MKIEGRNHLLVLCATGSLALCAGTQAAVLGMEPFDYAPGTPVYSLAGGTGWGGRWSDYAGGEFVQTASPGLTFGSLPTSGGAATSGLSTTPLGFTFLTRPVPATAASTLYVSFLLRRDLDTSANYGGLSILGSLNSIFVGKSGTTTTLGLEDYTGNIESSLTTLVTGDTYFLVTRFDFNFSGNQDLVSTFINPPTDGTIPSAADVLRGDLDIGSLDYVYLNNSGGWTTDEIRVGTDWPVPVPEPAASCIFAAGLALLSPLGLRLRVE